MRLTKQALEAINNKTTRTKLALALDFTERWICGLIDKNKDEGPLTTAKALRVISRETGLKKSEVLEESNRPVKA